MCADYAVNSVPYEIIRSAPETRSITYARFNHTHFIANVPLQRRPPPRCQTAAQGGEQHLTLEHTSV